MRTGYPTRMTKTADENGTVFIVEAAQGKYSSDPAETFLEDPASATFRTNRLGGYCKRTGI